MYCFNRLIIALLVVCVFTAHHASARTLLKNICRVKGQEENTLRGMGLVVGLKGTGDTGDSLPTMRALANAMEIMGMPLGPASLDGRRGGLRELKDTKNVALVWVSATVPSTGGRQGDMIDCAVSAISAKSLAGGRLAFAALQGPNVRDPKIYALCEGRVSLDDSQVVTDGKVFQGCRLEADIFTPFVQDNRVTLILGKNHADFQLAAEVADQINTHLAFDGSTSTRMRDDVIAQPLDAANIVVEIPEHYRKDPVEFVAQVMELPVFELQTEARVVINERAGSIVIDGDIEIGSVVISHKNVVVDTEGEAVPAEYVALDPGNTPSPKLTALVESLQAIKVPTSDVIEIIKGLDRSGKLHGRVIVE